MTKPTFVLALLFFGADVVLNLALLSGGSLTLGGLSLFTSILVFACGIIWFIHLDNLKLNIRYVWLVIPIGLFGLACKSILSVSSGSLKTATSISIQENLAEIGNIMMARYQMGMWIVSLIIFGGFLIASSLMEKNQ